MWVKQEAGWYIHGSLGSIVRERDNYWHLYSALPMNRCRGAFGSLAEAKAYAEGKPEKTIPL